MIEGTVGMTITQVFKYGGQNKVKVYVSLSIPIRLNMANFGLSIAGVSNNSYSWIFEQNSSSLSKVEVTITYK